MLQDVLLGPNHLKSTIVDSEVKQGSVDDLEDGPSTEGDEKIARKFDKSELTYDCKSHISEVSTK